MDTDPKDLILWAKQHGAIKVKVGEIEIDFGKTERPQGNPPAAPETPKPEYVKDLDGKRVEGVPDYVHAVGCKCEGCKVLFAAVG